MKLKRDSIKWAIKHISFQNDTDLFPKLREIDAVNKNPDKIIDYLSNIDIGAYNWKEVRRFLIPKAENSYRIATQLHLIDSIMLAAIIFEYGKKIETNRVPIKDKRVFNYRFRPSSDGLMYNDKIGWDMFWMTCRKKSEDYNYIVYLDISDFYNQIYHHTIEQQLDVCGFDKEISNCIIKFLGSVTQKVSRGIPIGPHAVHLLAELSMIPIDESLLSKGMDFCRFSDDIILFAKDRADAQIYIYKVAEILDKQQRLVLQQQKTRIFSRLEFKEYCQDMVENKPVNEEEKAIISILKKHSDNPYATISYKRLTNIEKMAFSKKKIERVISGILSNEPIDYIKLRWFLRRLAQVGCDSALSKCLSEYEKMLPALNDMILYFLSVSNAVDRNLQDIGRQVIAILDDKIIKANEFFQISALSLFGSTSKFNHIDKLIIRYDTSSENVKREIIFSSIPANASAWIRELKESFSTMNPWCKRAYIMAASILPADEKEVFLKKIVKPLFQSNADVLEQVLIEWSLKQ